MKSPVTRVVVTGPDGVGKTSLVGESVQSLSSKGARIVRLHFDPRADRDSRGNQVEPHGQIPHRMFASLAAVAVRFGRHATSWSVGALHARGQDFVIQERGWWDQLVDPRRYRLEARGVASARALSRALPRMDVHIALEGEPATIAARKEELSADETQRQIAMWRQLSPAKKRLDLDTTKEPETVTSSVLLKALHEARGDRLASSLGPVVGVPSRLEMVATRSAMEAIRALYRPHSTLGRFAHRSAGLRVWWPRNTDHGDMVAHIVAELDLPLDGFAVIRSCDRDRIVAATQVGHQIHRVLKAAPFEDLSLQREFNNLRSIGAIPGLRIPEVEWFDRIDEWLVGVMPAMEGTQKPPTTDTDTALGVAVALRWARGGAGVTHGDLSPWNLLEGNQPGLVDWESSQLSFTPGVDLAHYLRSVAMSRNGGTAPTPPADWRSWKIWHEYANGSELDCSAVLTGAESVLERSHGDQ